MTTLAPHASNGEGGKVFHCNCGRAVETHEFPYSGNVALKQSLDFAGLSHATAYKYGIVPEYGDDGQLADTGKVPPFPWIRMPDSLIRCRNGKKLFDAAEIRAWLEAVRERSRQIGAANTSNLSALNGRVLDFV